MSFADSSPPTPAKLNRLSVRLTTFAAVMREQPLSNRDCIGFHKVVQSSFEGAPD
jgi:hypothetical protein